MYGKIYKTVVEASFVLMEAYNHKGCFRRYQVTFDLVNGVSYANREKITYSLKSQLSLVL